MPDPISPTMPLTVLAKFDDVTVLQTAAYQTKTLQKEQAGYGALNLGLHVGDDAAQVLKNRMRLITAINEQLSAQQQRPIDSLYWLNQVHGREVYTVRKNALAMSPPEADAMISQENQLGLAIMTADCVPIVLYQPSSGQIAAIHAGWQGLACGVIKATMQHFTATGHIMAWIGVSISQDNYEVSAQVCEQLLAGCARHQLLPAESIELFSTLFSIPSENVVNAVKSNAIKVKLDLPKLAAHQLQHAGAKVENNLYPCSYADLRYYSYRRQTHLQQPATGRMALVIVRS